MTLESVRDRFHAERDLQARAGNTDRAAAMLDAALMLEADPQFGLPGAVEALGREMDGLAAESERRVLGGESLFVVNANRYLEFADRLRGLPGVGP